MIHRHTDAVHTQMYICIIVICVYMCVIYTQVCREYICRYITHIHIYLITREKEKYINTYCWTPIMSQGLYQILGPHKRTRQTGFLPSQEDKYLESKQMNWIIVDLGHWYKWAEGHVERPWFNVGGQSGARALEAPGETGDLKFSVPVLVLPLIVSYVLGNNMLGEMVSTVEVVGHTGCGSSGRQRGNKTPEKSHPLPSHNTPLPLPF